MTVQECTEPVTRMWLRATTTNSPRASASANSARTAFRRSILSFRDAQGSRKNRTPAWVSPWWNPSSPKSRSQRQECAALSWQLSGHLYRHGLRGAVRGNGRHIVAAGSKIVDQANVDALVKAAFLPAGHGTLRPWGFGRDFLSCWCVPWRWLSKSARPLSVRFGWVTRSSVTSGFWASASRTRSTAIRVLPSLT